MDAWASDFSSCCLIFILFVMKYSLYSATHNGQSSGRSELLNVHVECRLSPATSQRNGMYAHVLLVICECCTGLIFFGGNEDMSKPIQWVGFCCLGCEGCFLCGDGVGGLVGSAGDGVVEFILRWRRLIASWVMVCESS